MGILIIVLLGCFAGLLLFRRNLVPVSADPAGNEGRLSVIIPARNEASNLPNLLSSLQAQSLQPYEIIVVNDFSEDDTRAVAERFGVKVIDNTSLPQGWTGKNWAVWTGYLQATGDLFAFLDADVRLEPDALARLLQARSETGGAISVVPYHTAGKWRERLALITNILGLFAFSSPFERENPLKGLYGSCIVTSREHYEQVHGHEGIKQELLDDLNLGAKYTSAGIPVTNYIGYGLVSFRMYPNGLRSEIEGFGKGAALSTAVLNWRTIVLIALWVIGLLVSESVLLFMGRDWDIYLCIGYLLYILQLFYFLRYTGSFGVIMTILHIISSLFFLFVMVYSLVQVVFLGHVTWKGRQIKVGGHKGP